MAKIVGALGALQYIADKKTGMLGAYLLPEVTDKPDPDDGILIGSMLLRLAQEDDAMAQRWMETMKSHTEAMIMFAAKASGKVPKGSGLELKFSPNFNSDDAKAISEAAVAAGDDYGKLTELFDGLEKGHVPKPAPSVDPAKVAAELQAAFARFNSGKVN
jgi:hypothetical protein